MLNSLIPPKNNELNSCGFKTQDEADSYFRAIQEDNDNIKQKIKTFSDLDNRTFIEAVSMIRIKHPSWWYNVEWVYFVRNELDHRARVARLKRLI